MLIFLYGQDNFRRERKIQELLVHYRQKFDVEGLNIDRFDAYEHNLPLVRDVAISSPFIGTKRFVIIRAFSAWEDTKGLLELIQNIPEATIAIFSDGLDEKDFQDFQRKIGPIAKFTYSFNPLDLTARIIFALEEAKRLNVDLSQTTAKLLISRILEDTGSISTEIEKLAAHVGAQGIISEKLLNDHLGHLPEDDAFALIDSIFSGNKPRSIKLLLDQQELSSSVFALIGLLARQARLQIAVKSAQSLGTNNSNQIAQLLSIHQFVAQKLSALNISRKQGELFLKRIIEMDRAIKNGEIDQNTALIQMVMAGI